MDLQELYNRQLEFENLIIFKSKDWPVKKKLHEFDDKERTKFSKELALMLYQEVSEFVNAMGNYKLHKQTKDLTNIKDVKDEIADIMIFTLDIALTFGMTFDELWERVKAKQDKNFKRQEEGY